MTEIWINIEGSNYEVSNTQKVRNCLTGFVLKNSIFGSTEYVGVHIRINGKVRHCSIHRLVAIAFVPNPDNKPQVNHKDGDKKNNAPDNLEWSTQPENIQHMYDTGLKTYQPLHYKGKFGKDHNRSKSVECINTGIIYGSMSEAQRVLKIGQSGISWSIKHQRPIHGLHFRFISSPPRSA